MQHAGEFCPIHKKYKGRKKPKNECVHCLAVYLKMTKSRKPPLPPNKTHKDKSKYDRKRDKKVEEYDG